LFYQGFILRIQIEVRTALYKEKEIKRVAFPGVPAVLETQR
jgi:hypothetical protein